MQRVLCALLYCLFGLSALAGTHKISAEDPVVTVEIPNEWQTQKRGEFIEAIPVDSTLHIVLMSPEDNNIAEAVSETMGYARSQSGIQFDAGTLKKNAGKLNGMDVQNISWAGKDKNGPVKIAFQIIAIAEKKSVVVACWGPPEAESKHRLELDRLLKSIKKA